MPLQSNTLVSLRSRVSGDLWRHTTWLLSQPQLEWMIAKAFIRDPMELRDCLTSRGIKPAIRCSGFCKVAGSRMSTLIHEQAGRRTIFYPDDRHRSRCPPGRSRSGDLEVISLASLPPPDPNRNCRIDQARRRRRFNQNNARLRQNSASKRPSLSHSSRRRSSGNCEPPPRSPNFGPIKGDPPKLTIFWPPSMTASPKALTRLI